MLNAAKNTANKNSKKKKKDATSTIQGCEPRDCTVKGIQSSPKHNPKTVATTNVTVSGQPPAPPAPSSARPSPLKTGASLPTSPEGPHIIAYVHNLSPLKRNKRNTIDYTTLTLQTDATTTQPALCYSKTKRKLLHEHETKRAPIKISR